MKIKDLIVGFLVGIIAGLILFSIDARAMADTLDRLREMKNGVFLYVYNDKTQLWDRAREETLRNATCDKLHTYIIEKENNDTEKTISEKADGK